LSSVLGATMKQPSRGGDAMIDSVGQHCATMNNRGEW
jgi:hypothetical protein